MYIELIHTSLDHTAPNLQLTYSNNNNKMGAAKNRYRHDSANSLSSTSSREKKPWRQTPLVESANLSKAAGWYVLTTSSLLPSVFHYLQIVKS